ncbi:MAG: ParA family protein [Sphingomonadales bacterium]|nr:ParA family protein [Sphingomonadales bacterium]
MATIAIYSLKGGVGKTTLAVNLAWAAATLSSRRTLLWDLDPQAASTFLLPAKKGKADAQSVFTKDKKKRLQKLLASLARDYDRVILDCPPGLTETSEQVIRAADLIVVPVIPSPLSQRAFDDMAASLGKAKVLPVHVMVDRRRRLHGEAIAAQPDWPVIPMASIVEQMGDRRAAVGQFAGSSAAARAFAALWQTIEKRLAG